ncbi:hypothetical protein Tco_1345689 [Tanacetum coccineum]
MKNVADLIINGTWAWPPLRTDKAPKLEQLVVPNIVDSKDVLQLRGANGVLSRFSVAKVWEAIRPREVILKHDDLALVVNIEFVPSIVEE